MPSRALVRLRPPHRAVPPHGERPDLLSFGIPYHRVAALRDAHHASGADPDDAPTATLSRVAALAFADDEVPPVARRPTIMAGRP